VSETGDAIGFRVQTTAEHDGMWSILSGDHGALSCTHFNRQWQFHAKSHGLIGAVWLVHLTEHKVIHCYTTNAVFRCLVTRQLYLSCGFSSADCRCFQVSNSWMPIHSTVFVHHTALIDRDL